MTIRGGGHPKQAMVSTPLSRMGPPLRSFAADAHDCIMVRPPVDRPNTRLWRDDPRPMASSPSDRRCSAFADQLVLKSPNSVRERRGWRPRGWLSARASQQGDRAASAASGARKGWKLKLVPPGPNDGRGQLE